FTPDEKEKFHTKNEEMANRALRVLAIAYRELSPAEIEQFNKTNSFSKEDIEKELVFLGLAGMIDPPRDEVKEAVLTAKKAHIRIYIITGDHGLTARAIAKQLNIIDEIRENKIITGVELNNISDQDLEKYLSNKELDIIFARVSPQHKLRIVTILKKLEEIVAVTGDGVNDAPALKKADIGIAMGITGTDVSKEAANMILADDSFSSIVTAIKEGRTIYDNLKKFVFYVFSCNTGEVITVFAAIMLGLPAPLTAVLILSVNLGTDILPALALGVDPSEPGIMEAKPRDPDEKIMNRDFVTRFAYIGILIGAVVMGIYILTLYRYGWSWGEALTNTNIIHLKASSSAFALLIIIQMVQAFNARSDKYSMFKIGFFSNKYLLGAIVISVVMTFAMVENSFLQHYLKTTGLNFEDWGIILLASTSIFITEEIRKFFVRKKLAAVKVVE
ncbi:HAD-IC family P-type ATPase, partial [Patescibacteria group bacterium]|nr:HAD-IC family P-type ATPase [Patescibacteria group bacterium]